MKTVRSFKAEHQEVRRYEDTLNRKLQVLRRKGIYSAIHLLIRRVKHTHSWCACTSLQNTNCVLFHWFFFHCIVVHYGRLEGSNAVPRPKSHLLRTAQQRQPPSVCFLSEGHGDQYEGMTDWWNFYSTVTLHLERLNSAHHYFLSILYTSMETCWIRWYHQWKSSSCLTGSHRWKRQVIWPQRSLKED